MISWLSLDCLYSSRCYYKVIKKIWRLQWYSVNLIIIFESNRTTATMSTWHSHLPEMHNTSLLVPEHWGTGEHEDDTKSDQPSIHCVWHCSCIHTLYMYLGQYIINVNINYFSDILVLAFSISISIWRLWIGFGLLILHITKLAFSPLGYIMVCNYLFL